MNELLPCPFCGSDASTVEGDGRFYAACRGLECFCAVGEGYDGCAMPDHAFYEEEAATKAWNTRPSSAPGRDALREQFARIISPATWDKYIRRIAFLDKVQMEPDVRARAIEHEKGFCEQSLMKADKLLALISNGTGEAGDWNLIDSAPKDGTPMLFCNWSGPEQDVLPITSGFWSRISEAWYSEMSGQKIRPTHWQPLLAPPAGRAALSPPAETQAGTK